MPTGCNQRTPRKLNRAKALHQAARGMSNPEIAKQQGVNKSTVFRFMQRMRPEQQAVEQFKAGRADVLARHSRPSNNLRPVGLMCWLGFRRRAWMPRSESSTPWMMA